MVDLHAHTTASDGTLTPSELVALARQTGLQALAVTDHDTVDGLPEAITAAEEVGVELIPGIELAVDHPGGHFHMLGYFVDHRSQALNDRLRELRENRSRRNEQMIGKLQELGVSITLADVEAEAGGAVIARPHMARALVRIGIVPTLKAAFDHYLGSGCPAYVPKDKIGIEEGINLIHTAGGLAAVAHPDSLGIPEAQVMAEFKRLKAVGLDGAECYYSRFTPETSAFYRSAALEAGLLITGGSDFHGETRPDVRLGQVVNGLPAPYSLLEALKEARSSAGRDE